MALATLTARKRRKEGTWRDELVAGAKAPAFTLPRDGGGNGIAEGFQGPQTRPLFLPEGRHARLHQGGYRILAAARRLRQSRDRDSRRFGRSGRRPRTNSKPSIRSSIALASDETKEMLAAYGAWGEKSMYGRKFMGVIRKTFLIDGNGPHRPQFGRRCACRPCRRGAGGRRESVIPCNSRRNCTANAAGFRFLNHMRLISTGWSIGSAAAEPARSVDAAFVPIALSDR